MNRKFGQLVVEAVVPRVWKDLQQMHYKTGIAYSTLHAWKSGTQEPKLAQLQEVAALAQTTVPDLLSGGATVAAKGRVRDHPEWSGAVAEAEKKRPGKLPPGAYQVASMTAPARWPEHIDWIFAFDLAEFWHRHAADEDLADAETAAAQREMDAEDEAVGNTLRAKRPANAPVAPRPSKPTRAAKKPSSK